MTQAFQPPASAGERMILAALLAIFMVANIVTASRSPTVWMDEAVLDDPAANAYFGHGWHTAAHEEINRRQTYLSNGVTYDWLLYGWIKIFGFSPTSVRSLNFAIMAVMVWLMCDAARVSGAVGTPWGRFVLACLLLCGYAIAFDYRCGRYDILGAAELAAAFRAGLFRSSTLRYLALGLLGFVMMWTGLQLIPFLAALGIILLVVVGRSVLPSLAATAVGAAMGFASFHAALKRLGLWDGLMALKSKLTHNDAASAAGGIHKLAAMAREVVNGITVQDHSLPFLIVLFLLAWAARRRMGRGSALAFGLLSVIGIPIAMTLAGHYPIYYSWMTYVPVALAAAALWERLGREGTHPSVRCFATALVIAACVVGLPLRLAMIAGDWNRRSYVPVEQLVERNVKNDDWVYSSYQAFYPVKRAAELTILPPYIPNMTPDEKQRVNVMVIDPADFPALSQEFGGTWRDTGDRVAPQPAVTTIQKLMARVGGAARLYDLEVYRREAN